MMCKPLDTSAERKLHLNQCPKKPDTKDNPPMGTEEKQEQCHNGKLELSRRHASASNIK